MGVLEVGEELGAVVDGDSRALEVGLVARDDGLDAQLLGALAEAGVLEIGPRRLQRVLDVVFPQRADARQPLHFQQAELHGLRKTRLASLRQQVEHVGEQYAIDVESWRYYP